MAPLAGLSEAGKMALDGLTGDLVEDFVPMPKLVKHQAGQICARRLDALKPDLHRSRLVDLRLENVVANLVGIGGSKAAATISARLQTGFVI